MNLNMQTRLIPVARKTLDLSTQMHYSCIYCRKKSGTPLLPDNDHICQYINHSLLKTKTKWCITLNWLTPGCWQWMMDNLSCVIIYDQFEWTPEYHRSDGSFRHIYNEHKYLLWMSARGCNILDVHPWLLLTKFAEISIQDHLGMRIKSEKD